jgi:hypothetical protein
VQADQINLTPDAMPAQTKKTPETPQATAAARPALSAAQAAKAVGVAAAEVLAHAVFADPGRVVVVTRDGRKLRAEVTL